MRTLAIAAALLLIGCEGGSPTAARDALRQAVNYGAPDTYHEGVIYLRSNSGTACSGSVIAPRLVLTANHCVEGTSETGWVYGLGQRPARLEDNHSIEIIRPGPFLEDSEDDVALIVFEHPIETTIYVPVWELETDIVGDLVSIVGYGLDEHGLSGRRLRGTMEVAEVTDLSIDLTGSAWPGSGDSGGPVFNQDGRIIAVISRGGPHVGIVTRVDAHRWLMDPVLRREGGCFPDDPELCDGRDNDCDDEIDEGCSRPGEPCDGPETCTTGRCELVAGESICTLPCSPADEDACWAGAYCDAEACGEGWCRPGDGGEGRLGDPCRDDLDCRSRLCRAPAQGPPRCTTRCELDTLQCAPGELCAPLDDGCGACFEQDLVEGPRGLGEPCEGDRDCRSGRCLEETARAYCSEGCDESSPCPDGMHCRAAACVLGDEVALGGLCVSDDDCRGDLVCRSWDGEAAVCTAECGETRTWCPLGARCDYHLSLCVPDGAPLGATCDPQDRASCAEGDCRTVAGEPLCARPCGRGCPDGFLCDDGAGNGGLCVPLGPLPSTAGCQCSPAPGQVPRHPRRAVTSVADLILAW